VPAARTLCSEFAERTEIQVEFSASHVPEHLAKDTELNFYRILQEALGNIEKHAGAQRVWVEFSRRAGFVRLIIRDDGSGFNTVKAKPRENGHGMGLVDMKERAGSVCGCFTLTSCPGNGTEIIVEMPVQLVEHAKSKPGEKGQTKED